MSTASTQYYTVEELLAHPFYTEPLRPWGGKPWRSRIVVTPTGCFEWQGAFNSKGYPSMGPRGLVHRLAWMAIVGPIAEGHEAHHDCGNKKCVNVAHLQCLSAEEHALLEGRPRKLDVQKVIAILMMLDGGATRLSIARFFGISPSHVTGIKHGRSWRDVVTRYRVMSSTGSGTSASTHARAA